MKQSVARQSATKQGASPKHNPVAEQLRFLRGLVANPRGVGSIAPSAPDLGRAMASQIDLDRAGPVLELGPGSGAITRELLAYGVAPERLTVIEYDPAFVDLLRRQLPAGVTIIKGDAFDLDGTLGANYPQPFSAIVSCIPLLNFSKERRKALLESSFSRMAPDAPFIQFTYGLARPADPLEAMTVARTALVWRNIPPAHVWTYRREKN